MRPLRPRDVAPDDLDAPFWEACRQHRFLVHRCLVCGRAYWPASCCIDHGVSAMQWQDASGFGEVHTYTVVHHAYEPSMADRLPYVLAVVRLDEGPFFHSDIVGCPPESVHVGMRVAVLFDELDAGHAGQASDAGAPGDRTVLPRFAPLPDSPPPPNKERQP